MIHRLSKTFWLLLVLVFVGAGCDLTGGKEPSGYRLLMDPDLAIPDYASRAVESAGGRHAWAKVKKLQFHCVVTFYQPDGSFYLTEQQHEIYPWSNIIRISALEPQGNFVWQLSKAKFRTIEGSQQADFLPAPMSARGLAEAILNITTAPARLLDSSFASFTKVDTPVKIEGVWYYPIGQSRKVVDPYWSKVLFCQNRDSSLVDILWFADVDEQKFLAVRGYDYRKVEKQGVLVPTGIEIFTTDAAGTLQKRLVKIDYHKLLHIPE